MIETINLLEGSLKYSLLRRIEGFAEEDYREVNPPRD